MRKVLILFVGLLTISWASAQETIELPYDSDGGISWEGGEKEYHSELWDTPVVTNVSKPTMSLYRPEPSLANGTAVIIAPGGGLYAHSITKEGNEVAQWLSAKGITAFVLKYRLVPTGEDGVKEIMEGGETVLPKVKQVMPLSISDGLNAIAYIRKNATSLGVDPNKIGFMGFSAGGAVTMGVTFEASPETMPNFIVPVYAWMPVMDAYEVPEEAPPMLVICASDDPLLLAPASVKLYSDWLKEGGRAELHMYSQGGHGFGMKKAGLPSDNWIDRFYEWSVAEGITSSKIPE